MPVLIAVRAARSDHRVALNERHADHPGGAAWVTGDGQVHHVALTREVARRIGDGSLVLVEAVGDGGAPLEIGERIGGFLPPRGDETPLPAEAEAPPPPPPVPARKKGGV